MTKPQQTERGLRRRDVTPLPFGCESQQSTRTPARRPAGEGEWSHMEKVMPKKFTPITVQLLTKYAVSHSGCWEWTGQYSHAGYGRIAVRTQGMRGPRCLLFAHRLSWEAANGPIPPGLCVCHKCDNPPCINPDHLFLGTHGDNAADREAKGRGRHTLSAGTRNRHCKLTVEQVLYARDQAGKGVSVRVLAEELGVRHETVSRIVRGTTWKILQ